MSQNIYCGLFKGALCEALINIAVAVTHGQFGRSALLHLDRPVATHVHRESHLAFYLHGGPHAHKYVDTQELQLKNAHGIAINPWEPHSFSPCPSGQKTAILLLYINQRWLNDNNSSIDKHTRFHRPLLTLNRTLQNAVNELSRAHYDGMTHSDFFVDRFNSLAIASMNASAAEHATDTPIPTPPTTPGPGDHRINKAIGLMINHVSTGIALEDVAINAGISRPHFFKLFKDQTGITPNLYMNTLRVEYAINLLTTTNATVTEIGRSLGYKSQPSFSRFFYMNVGVAPTEYRHTTHTNRRDMPGSTILN